MEELKKIRRSNIRVIVAIILVIIDFSIVTNWYYKESEALRQKANDWQTVREVEKIFGNIGSYIGNNKMGIVVKELCDKVLRGNSQIIGSKQIVNLNEIKFRDAISTDCKYDIKMSGDEQGLIIGIGIIKKVEFKI